MTPGQPPPLPGRLPAAQFYVTHCTKADSVLNNPGFSVRAASTANPALARLALERPPYELPMDLWSQLPRREQAPRRLARARHGNGTVWVTHSSYLEKDTMNRDRSYFSHVLLLPEKAATPQAVLAAWASEKWMTEYASGASRTLPAPAGLPEEGSINDRRLKAFLADVSAAAEDLATQVIPARLNGAARRDLVARTLAGVLLAVQGEGTPRNRLTIHGEPGLVALLIFAAARLLPPAWVADLTFSTYEPPHRGLREIKDAVVVGTYFGNVAKSLDSDLLISRGYGIDTFHTSKYSPELQAVPDTLIELVSLAATGDWPTLASIQQLCGSERVTLPRLAEIIGISRGVDRLEAAQATLADPIVHQRDLKPGSRKYTPPSRRKPRRFWLLVMMLAATAALGGGIGIAVLLNQNEETMASEPQKGKAKKPGTVAAVKTKPVVENPEEAKPRNVEPPKEPEPKPKEVLPPPKILKEIPTFHIAAWEAGAGRSFGDNAVAPCSKKGDPNNALEMFTAMTPKNMLDKKQEEFMSIDRWFTSTFFQPDAGIVKPVPEGGGK